MEFSATQLKFLHAVARPRVSMDFLEQNEDDRLSYGIGKNGICISCCFNNFEFNYKQQEGVGF